MRNTRWIYKTTTDDKKNKKYSKDLISILEARDVKTDDEIERFLYGDIENLRNPFDIKDLEKTIDILLEARENKKNIWIYGDYDVDGITATSILYRVFKEIGIEVNYYIPLRDEGYGLNKEAIQKIKDDGGDLIITVDCGISSVDEVDFANSIGMDMIITDHHEINNDLPKALCVVNVKREDNDFNFKGLSGAGTAFMLALGLFRKLNSEEKAYKYLDIAAIGTVADLVPLIEDNRIIVKKGLEQLKRTNWKGLKVLERKLFPDFSEKTYDTYDIGFIIAPIFNAAGRLEDAKKSVELLINEDNKILDIISYELINQNEDRKDIQKEIFDLVVEEIEEKKLDTNGILIVAKEKLHSGVIGIVASKVLDRYYKPTIIIDIKKDEGVGVASCRSIESFNIIEALNHVRDVFVKYGGHSGAAGFTIPIEKIDELKERLNEYIKTQLGDEDYLRPIKIDKEVQIQKISFDFLQEISKMEPFGFGNSTPIFAMKNCKFTNFRKIGKDLTHLMLNIIKNGVEVRNCVWWNSADLYNEIEDLETIDIAFKLKTEIFRDKYQYKIFIEDIKPSQKDNTYKNIALYEDTELYDTVFPIKTVFYTRKRIKDNLTFNFYDNKVYVLENKVIVGELDDTTSYLISNLKNRFGYNFSCELEEIKETSENFNVYINIHRDFSFETYKIKNSEIFRDIKEYLIGQLNYNSFQKNILASIFKEKNNTIGIYKENRGIGIIIKTIGLYYKSIGKKVLLVTETIEDKNLENFLDISYEIEEGYDFYIFLNNYPKSKIDNYLIFIKEGENIKSNKNIKIVEDKYVIPKNIEIVCEKELINYQNSWSKKLSLKNKEYIYNLLKKGEKVYGKKDIVVLL